MKDLSPLHLVELFSLVKMINNRLRQVGYVFLLVFMWIAPAYAGGLGADPSGGGGWTPSGIMDDFDTTSMLNMLQNLDRSMPGIGQFLLGLCYLMGLGFVVSAVWRLKKFGHRTAFMHTETGIIAPLVLFLMGVLLLYTPGLFKIFNYTLFANTDFQNISDWQSQHTGGKWMPVISPMLQLIQVIGLVSFIRGWLVLSRATNAQSQPGNVSKGIVYVISGILAMNVTRTIDLITTSLGLLG